MIWQFHQLLLLENSLQEKMEEVKDGLTMNRALLFILLHRLMAYASNKSLLVKVGHFHIWQWEATNVDIDKPQL